MHRIIIFAVILTVLAVPSFAAEKTRKIKRLDTLLAVFDFDVQENINKSIGRSLAESVRIEIVKSGKYEVIDRSNMNKILKEQAFQMSGCVAKECAVEAGQMLGVGKIVVGTLGLIGQTYYLTLSVVNVETGKTEFIKDEECKCEVDALIASSKRVARGLMGDAAAGRRQTASFADRIATSPTLTTSTYKDPMTGMEFVLVKGGCYLMGDAAGEGNDDERPIHEVCVDDFYIGKYKVTEAQWLAVMGILPSSNGDTYPVSKISWDDALAFSLILKQKTGANFRLPTEAEWEYAARSGGKNERWPGTNDKSAADEYVWYKPWYRGGLARIANGVYEIGQKKPNGLGLYDMCGNVKEYVSDYYDERYYASSPRENPKGPSAGSDRVMRGGSYDTYVMKARTMSRDKNSPSSKNNDSGVRLVLETK